MPVTLRTSSGQAPEQVILRIARAIKPTHEDLLYAGQRQITRILERTARGVDVNGRPFAPYSKNGPYYYNPNGRLGPAGRAKLSEKQQKDSAKRMQGKIGGSLSRTGRTVKFPSYAAFKQWLGRSGVDLTGPRAPHMLQALTAKASGVDVTLGIYGTAAARATGHNFGARHLPQRRFFGASADDAKQMVKDIYVRIKARLGAA